MAARRTFARARSGATRASVAAIVTGLVALATLPTGTAAAASDPVVTVNPTTNLQDGQPVVINVKANTDSPVSGAVVELCRLGPTYQSTPFVTLSPTADDFATNGPNCPRNPISSSSEAYSGDFAPNFQTPDGESFQFSVGSGVVNWKDSRGTDYSLTCDSDNPCALVVEVAIGGSVKQWRPYVFKVEYAKDDPYAGCGGPAQNIVESGGSDRMIDAWINWTRQECAKPGRSGAATRASFVGEGNAIDSFVAKTVDLAYSAGGFDSGMALQSPPDQGQSQVSRASVAIPIALNAEVIGVAGGQLVNGHGVPFHDIKLKADEIAGMVSGGIYGIDNYSDDILARNPQLVGAVFDVNAPSYQMAAYATVDAGTWYTTRLLTKLAPDAWKVPVNSTYFSSNGGKPRAITNSFALADPSFNNALTLLTGRPPLRKGAFGIKPQSSGVFAVTDLATADALGFVPVQIQNSRGDFVAPTADTMTAAVTSMKADPQGVLISDPSATAAEGSTQPYPLTMVEYAIVPTEPLVEESSCTARTGSQQLLKGWLDYVLGDGQSALPAGMVALPADLKASAQSSLSKVGASPVTGTCAGKVNDPGPDSPLSPATSADSANNGGPAASPSGDSAAPNSGDSNILGGGGGGGSALGSTSSHSSSSGSSSSATPPSGTNSAQNAALTTQSGKKVDIPLFGGRGLASWVITAMTLGGIVALTSLASMGSAGKLAGVSAKLNSLSRQVLKR